MIVGGNRIVDNFSGLVNQFGGSMQTRGDNAVSGNVHDVVGTLTSLGGT